jgi:phosphoribosylaminoimidazole-succinocarboxamide synthase
MEAVIKTDLPSKLIAKGKVRDMYDLGESLLMVATDRISAFDCVLPDGIPGKGEVLNKISAYWFENTSHIIPNHMISIDPQDFPEQLRPYQDLLGGRSMLVEKMNVLPIECVVRGYLAGSGWSEYKKTGTVCGIRLPEGLRQSEKLPEPIFTPSTKEESGHDINITFQEMADRIGQDKAEKLRDISLKLYEHARDEADSKGIIICDTKFEYGEQDGQIKLIDEALTPDSSRFWPKSQYQPGKDQESFDKQYVRDYLNTLGWDKKPPAPPLPEDVIARTREKYLQAYETLTGQKI